MPFTIEELEKLKNKRKSLLKRDIAGEVDSLKESDDLGPAGSSDGCMHLDDISAHVRLCVEPKCCGCLVLTCITDPKRRSYLATYLSHPRASSLGVYCQMASSSSFGVRSMRSCHQTSHRCSGHRLLRPIHVRRAASTNSVSLHETAGRARGLTSLAQAHHRYHIVRAVREHAEESTLAVAPREPALHTERALSCRIQVQDRCTTARHASTALGSRQTENWRRNIDEADGYHERSWLRR